MSFIKRCSYIAAAAALVLCASCGTRQSQSSSALSSSVSSSQLSAVSSAAETQTPKYTLSNKYYKSDVWRSVPLVTANGAARSMSGEGGVTVTDLAFAPSNGKIAFAATESGGIYRSKNGGATWEPCNIGFSAAGAACIAVDPKNSNRVLAVGTSFEGCEQNGLYLSLDGGSSWKQVLSCPIGGTEFRNQLAYDVSSYSSDKKLTATVYWSREGDLGADGTTAEPALYKSTDGGVNWQQIANTSAAGGCEIAVVRSSGDVLCGSSDGLYKSADGGSTFKMILDKPVASVCTSAAEDKSAFILTDDGLYKSTDGGNTFTRVGDGTAAQNAHSLVVSGCDAAVMVLQSSSGTSYYSTDGGKNWQGSVKDTSGSFLPYVHRTAVFALHPTDKNAVLTTGGDYIMKSKDGGRRYTLSNNGVCGNYGAGQISHNVNNNNLIYIPSQNYNGAYSTDGGKVWNYIQWYKPAGGNTYGGYVLNKNTVITCLRDTDNVYKGGDVYYVAVTFDGGRNISVFTDCLVNSGQMTCVTGLKGNDKVAFVGGWRTEDGGKTWDNMSGCSNVLTYNYRTGALIGSYNNTVVTSTDGGKTWKKMAACDRNIIDVAYNADKGTLYVVTVSGLFRMEKGQSAFERISIGAVGIRSVCVDPAHSGVVYIGCSGVRSQSDMSVLRSSDDGLTWTNLTRTAGDKRSGADGGREALSVRVDPKTGELWVSTAGHGVWKLPYMSDKTAK